MDCSLTGSSVLGIFQVRVPEWVAISFSRGSSQPRNWSGVSRVAADSLLSEPPGKPIERKGPGISFPIVTENGRIWVQNCSSLPNPGVFPYRSRREGTTGPAGERLYLMPLQILSDRELCTGIFWTRVLVWLCLLRLFDLCERRRDHNVSRSFSGLSLWIWLKAEFWVAWATQKVATEKVTFSEMLCGLDSGTQPRAAHSGLVM